MLKFYYIKMVLSEENAMNPKIVNEDTEFLCKVILNLNSVEECYSFLDDLCTVQEIHAMAQRLKVAYMLSNHEIYADIVKDTGASTATISRVNRALSYGSDGYTQAFKRLAENQKKEDKERAITHLQNFMTA